MTKSKFFWAGAILLAIIPLFALDIPKHYIDWTRDVHDEAIEVVHNGYNFTRQQKGEILTNLLDANKQLMAMMYIKSFLDFILLLLSIWCFIKYGKTSHASNTISTRLKLIGLTVLMLACTTTIKIYSWYSFNGDDRIKLLSLSPADTTLQNICTTNFKGKMVYVDFWGTTCGPCLEEFRNFTKPLKAKYHSRTDIAYLYVCRGHEAIWRQQLKKFDIAGSHAFLDDKAYSNLYKQAIKGDKDTLEAVPRYLIIDKTGKIAKTNAPRPSDVTAISNLLDKYLAVK